MSVPNSILSVLLVVVWLFVLVPMFVNRRPKVMTVSQTALNTRVLFRGGLDKLKHRIRPGVAGEAPIEREDDEEEGSTARRPVAEVFADEHEDLEAADEAEFVEDAEFVESDGPPRRAREEEVVDEAEIVAIRDADDRFEDQDDLSELEEERLEHVAHRLGRGGYNPTADASARAQRYAVRQRIVLALLISFVAATVLAFAMTPLVWYAAGAIAATLVGYLAYLRRQVRIEERIRARRMARFARSQNPRLDVAPGPRAERRGPERAEQTARPVKKGRGPQVVAIDDDDPDFADLPSPSHGLLRRASGE
ncbi:MAG: divisome protein SepX/GlpR [Segniliparus sp.]|uniref:divisome protein SepX/GlpR n=1 Tax=Segniliparus sp. TaxID=2804064 RepID=UPI003F303C0C